MARGPQIGNATRGHAQAKKIQSSLPPQWFTTLTGVVVPLGLSMAACASTRRSERAGITAWIAVAVVGTASVIAAGRCLRETNEQD